MKFHKYIKNTSLEVPAFVLLLLACWMVVYNVGLLIQNSFGSVLMILTMPIWWHYIVNPILDLMGDFFTSHFWD